MKNKNKKGNQFSKSVKDSSNVSIGLSTKWGDIEIKVDDALFRAGDADKPWFNLGK